MGGGNKKLVFSGCGVSVFEGGEENPEMDSVDAQCQSS